MQYHGAWYAPRSLKRRCALIPPLPGPSLLIKLPPCSAAARFDRKMRLVRTITCYIPLFTYIVSTTAQSYLTLSQWQQISGFSDACFNAYNTPLNQCSQLDFQDGRSCSMDCVALLEEVSKRINTACKGTRAFPNTLIGMFFTSAGVQALCPNVLASGGSTGSNGGDYGGNTGGNNGGYNGGGTGGETGGQSGQTTVVVSTSQAPLKPSILSSVTETTPTQQISETQSALSQTPAVASTSQATPEPSTSGSETMTTPTQQISDTQPAASSAQTSLVESTVSTTAPAVEPTLNTAATLTQSGLGGLKSTTVSPNTSSVSSTSTSPSTSVTSSAQRDGSHNGSGGTPFDISASSRTKAATPPLLGLALGLIALTLVV